MEENKLVTLKLVGFNESENRNLDSILTLAERSLTRPWRVMETASADFFLLSASSSKQIDTDPTLQKLPREQCIFCITDNNSINENTLNVDANGTPGLRALVELFNKISEQPSTISSQNTPTETKPTPSENLDFFDFEKGFLGLLLNTKNDIYSVKLLNKQDYAPLYINNLKDSYYSHHSLKQLADYMTEIENLSISSCSEIELLSYIKSESLKARPLKDLVWYATLKTSTGKAIKGYSSTDIVTLTQWPDLKLPDCIGYAKLATFMKNNVATLPIIAEQTKVPLAEIYPFYNACYLIGLVELKLEIELNQKKISTDRLELLSKIGTRLEQ
ncbi:MAG: hypothetical protein GQ569_03560 [Methylococcaceae bacterium]|nr:hypothetical protein [Methylococcaceae bacterium]